MKSEWTEYRVSKTPVFPINGEYVYTVYRKRIDGVDHSGNREEVGVYDSKEKAQKFAAHMNHIVNAAQKQRLCNLLLPVLRETRNLADLTNLRYDQATECVIATFQNGAHEVANIACDSGTAAIVDIIKQIV